MPLTDFFRINLPYGLKKDEDGRWFAFNREYAPLGWNKKNHQFKKIKNEELPVYTSYKRLTDASISKIIKDENRIHRNEKGEITSFFLYNDGTNPQSFPKYWDEYFEKIKALSKFEIKPIEL